MLLNSGGPNSGSKFECQNLANINQPIVNYANKKIVSKLGVESRDCGNCKVASLLNKVTEFIFLCFIVNWSMITEFTMVYIADN